ALVALFDTDYEIYTETLANVSFGWSPGDPARHFAQMLREAQTHDEATVFLRAYTQADVSDLLPSITAPTLIIHHRDARLVPMEVARNLAARIPNARLAVIEGSSVAGNLTSAESLAAVDNFLLGHEYVDPEPVSVSASVSIPAGTAIILLADVVY